MREVELKSVVADVDDARRRLGAAGATLEFSGMLVDRRYDTPDLQLRRRDEVLRVRETRGDALDEVRVDFKGPTSYPDGFKVRDEVGTTVADGKVIDRILQGLGYVITREIERVVEVFHVTGATVRLEHYPRMDVLVEVEGDPAAIEAAIAVLGLPRAGFTAERLSDFARRFEARTGQRAALCAPELAGIYPYRLDDA